MAEAQVKLGYLLSPTFQIENTNGKPIVGGYIEVYYAGTDDKYITYQNFDYTQNPFKIPLGSDGRAVVLADADFAYDVYVRDSYGNLVFSRMNVAPGNAGGVAGGGLQEVSHDETLTGKGTLLSPLGVSPLINLAVDDTMTAYEATVSGRDALVLGVNSDWFDETFSGAWSGKVDYDEFSACCSAVNNSLANKVDNDYLVNNYYDSNEVFNIFLPRSAYTNSGDYYTKSETYNRSEIRNFLDVKQDTLTFGYDEFSNISSINNSALWGAGGGSGSSGGEDIWITGAKIINSEGYLQPGQWFQMLSSFTVSSDKNHCIAVKGGAYNFPTTAMFYEWLNLSSYLPSANFTAYTASINGTINDLYGKTTWNTNNKLDISAFSDWSAAYAPTSAETYLVTGGNYINISSDDVNKVTTVSVTGLDTTLQSTSSTLNTRINGVSAGVDYVSGAIGSVSSSLSNSLTGKKDKQTEKHLSDGAKAITAIHQDANGVISADFDTNFIPSITGQTLINPTTSNLALGSTFHVVSSQNVSGDKNHAVSVLGATYKLPTTNDVTAAINGTNAFAQTSSLNTLSSFTTNNISNLYSNDTYLSGAIDYVSANAGDEFPASANDAITAYQTYSGDYYTTAEANTMSSMFSGAIDYVSANAGGNIISPKNTLIVNANSAEASISGIYPAYNEHTISSFSSNSYTISDWNRDYNFASATSVKFDIKNNNQYVSARMGYKVYENDTLVSSGNNVTAINITTSYAEPTDFELLIEPAAMTQVSFYASADYYKIIPEQVVNLYDVPPYTQSAIDSKSQIGYINGNTSANPAKNANLLISGGNSITGSKLVFSYEKNGAITSENVGYTVPASPKTGTQILTNNYNGSNRWQNSTDIIKNSTPVTYLSGAVDYVSANAGLYNGIDPIQVNNVDHEISITGESLSAGPGIDIFASGGYIVLSADVNNAIFPMTSTDGSHNYTFDARSSALYLTTATGAAGATTKFDVRGVRYDAFPSTDVSASWYSIIDKANEGKLNVSAYDFPYNNNGDNRYRHFSAEELSALTALLITTPYYPEDPDHSSFYSAYFPPDNELVEGMEEISNGESIKFVKQYDVNADEWRWFKVQTTGTYYSASIPYGSTTALVFTGSNRDILVPVGYRG